MAQVKAACGGDLDRVRRCVKVTVFVNAVPGFTQHPEVANGASDLFVEVFGDAGRHARAAVGAGSLPRNVADRSRGGFRDRVSDGGLTARLSDRRPPSARPHGTPAPIPKAARDPHPFTRYEFFAALEESGSADRRTGWRPCHLTVERDG